MNDSAVSSGQRPRRQQLRAVETQDRLLRTARRLFSAKGYDGVSVRQVEELAGVKRGLVAYHFGDKERLWRESVDQLFTELGADFGGRIEALADVSAHEAARAMVRAFVRYSAANPELNRLMMQESMSDSWRVNYIVDEHIRPLQENLMTAMPEAAQLMWGDGDPHRYYLFIGASAFVFSAEHECRRLFDSSPFDQEFIERHAELVVQMFVGAAGPD